MNMKQQIENIIKKNLPKEKIISNEEFNSIQEDYSGGLLEGEILGHNQCLSQIPVSLIADEVLKVVEKARQEGIERGKQEMYIIADSCEKKGWDFKRFLLSYGALLLSNLSPNKENENNE